MSNHSTPLPRGAAVTHTAVSLGTSSASLASANAARQILAIQNNHASAVIHVRLDGGVASATTGIQIGAGQLLNVRDLGAITKGAVTGISDTAATPVVVVEG